MDSLDKKFYDKTSEALEVVENLDLENASHEHIADVTGKGAQLMSEARELLEKGKNLDPDFEDKKLVKKARSNATMFVHYNQKITNYLLEGN